MRGSAFVRRRRRKTSSVCKLDWITCAVDVPALTPAPPYDLIVGADVVYNEKYLPAFVATIDLLLEQSPRAQVYVAVDVRDEGLVRRFEAALAEQLRLAVKVIPKKKLPEPYNGPDWVHATVYHAMRRAPGGAAAGEACG
ncbi:hypothetical protein DIPPA_32079 [Diplonema papillatum]|nr:hypothetical protein DIPPA_32079 [Diplonema papillatum]